MIYLIGLLIFAFVLGIKLINLLGTNDMQRVMKDFCKIECKQSIKSKYKFCC